jgi:hypothetical protein
LSLCKAMKAYGGVGVQLYTFLAYALHRNERLGSHPSLLMLEKKNLKYPSNKRLGEPHESSTLPQILLRSLGSPSHSLFTIPTELSRFV